MQIVSMYKAHFEELKKHNMLFSCREESFDDCKLIRFRGIVNKSFTKKEKFRIFENGSSLKDQF